MSIQPKKYMEKIIWRFLLLLRVIKNNKKFQILNALYNLLANFFMSTVYKELRITQRARNFLQKLINLVGSDHYDVKTADIIYSEVAKCLNSIQADSKKAIDIRINAALYTGRFEEWVAAEYSRFEKQERSALASSVEHPNLRIIEPSFVLRRIGHSINLDAYIKSGILGLRSLTRTVMLFYPWTKKSYVANACLLEYFRKYIDIVEDPAEILRLEPLKYALEFDPLHAWCIGRRVFISPHSAISFVGKQWEIEARKPLFLLTDEHRERGWKTLKRMGVPLGKWFVTLHVREGRYLDIDNNRDSDITSYFEAIKLITDRGGYVIRMGDPSMSLLPKITNVIDYAHSSEKSDWMDVFLCAAAKFMIGTSSGLSSVSYIFGVPIAMTNYFPSSAMYLGSQDLFLPRLLRRCYDGSLLSFAELMSKPFSVGYYDGVHRNILQVETIPNDAEEIRGLAEEMLDKIDGNLTYKVEDQFLQKCFKAITAESETLIGLPDFEIRCRLGRYFLSRYQQLLDSM